MSSDRLLAAILAGARGARGLRTMWATVTSASPLMVRPDNADAGVEIGPLALVRATVAADDHVLCIWVPEAREWVVLGQDQTAAAILVPYYRRMPAAVAKPWLALVAPDDTVTLEQISTETDLRLDNYAFIKNASPHAFQMSDGAYLLLVNRPQFNTGYHYARRSPSGAWSGMTLFADDPNYAFNEADAHFVQHGDDIYAFTHGYQPPTTGLHRLAYDAGTGTVSVTSVDLTNLDAQTFGVYGYGIYYDADNGLVHIWYGDSDTNDGDGVPNTNWLEAYDPTALTAVYRTSAPKPQKFNYVADATDIDGPGGATFLLGSYTTFGLTPGCRIDRVVATGSGHTITQESGVPTPPSVAVYVGFVWDGSNLNAAALLGFGGLIVLRRLGQDSYGTWDQIADTGAYRQAYNNLGLARLADGDIAVVWDWMPTSSIARISFRRRVGGTWGPFVTVDDTTSGPNATYFPSSNRLAIR